MLAMIPAPILSGNLQKERSQMRGTDVDVVTVYLMP